MRDQPTVSPTVGVVEWFRPDRPGEWQRVEAVVEAVEALGVEHLRFDLSWALSMVPGVNEWYDRLFEHLAGRFELLPCVTYTPPSYGVEPSSAAPPKNPKDYADFLDVAIRRWGHAFETVELWNEPNGISYWRFDLDPGWRVFREMIAMAGYWAATHHEKKVVLGGPSPIDLGWLGAMFHDGAMDHVHVVGIHGFPGTWDSPERPGFPWRGWATHVGQVRELLRRCGSDAEIWITEAGCSSLSGEERQVEVLADLLEAPVPRVYWYSVHDFEGLTVQEREQGWVSAHDYHMGLIERGYGSDGRLLLRPKGLYEVWARGGLDAVRARARGTVGRSLSL